MADESAQLRLATIEGGPCTLALEVFAAARREIPAEIFDCQLQSVEVEPPFVEAGV